MPEEFSACAGAVCSADIAVPEHEREFRFYTQVLTTGERPLWSDDLLNNLGVPVIGLGNRADYRDLPLQWMPHIQVADVAASAKRAVELGGKELMHTKGDDGTSPWAVLQDPNGAAFGVIPVLPEDALPSPAEGPVGRLVWLDLTVRDADRTRDFYQAVVGWSYEAFAMGEGDDRYADYVMLDAAGNATAGVCHARGPNAGLPPVWLLYLPVGDFAESRRRAAAEGGEVIHAVDGTNHKYAVVRDPVGAHFAITPG
jgi:uncharacterized protein